MTPRRSVRELWAVATLAGLAAVRVLVFASAFPFFHINDEHQHVDAVYRYARGELPGAEIATLDPAVAHWAMRFGTFEYVTPGPEIPPPFLERGLAPDSREIRRAYAAYAGVPATEFDSPPVYYLVAGRWYALGAALGLRDLRLLYWLRWLNAPVLALLVLGSYLLLRGPYADLSFVRLGVPALLAGFPHDLFFAVTADAFSALSGGLAFALVVRLGRGGAGRPARLALAGLGVAAAFLTKYTNVVFALLAGVASLLWAGRRGGRDGVARPLAAFWCALLVAVGSWLARNQAVLGDLMGTQRKVASLGWSLRPVAAYADHPLFSPAGAAHFLGELPALFWRGELPWHGVPMALPWLDALYVGTSLAFVLLAAWNLRRRGGPQGRRALEAFACASVLGAVALLAALSVWLDFASWGTPTREDPFFVHGRLVSGVLLPFCVVWVRGLQLACARLPGRAGELAPWGALAAWLLVVTASEIALSAPAFASPWNLYHAG